MSMNLSLEDMQTHTLVDFLKARYLSTSLTERPGRHADIDSYETVMTQKRVVDATTYRNVFVVGFLENRVDHSLLLFRERDVNEVATVEFSDNLGACGDGLRVMEPWQMKIPTKGSLDLHPLQHFGVEEGLGRREVGGTRREELVEGRWVLTLVHG